MADQESKTQTFPLKYKGLVTKLDPTLLTDGQMQAALNIMSVQEGNISLRSGRHTLGTMPSGATNPLKIAKLSIPNQPVPVASATNATPIVITTAVQHGWLAGFGVTIRGVTGNTAANGAWVIGSVTAFGFTLVGSVGNGAYVNGGEVSLFSGDAGIRYVGEKDDIYRTLDNYASYTKVSPTNGVSGSRNIFPNRWSMTPYSAGATANPYAYFACPGAMLKDQGNAPFTPLHNWGITPALAAASAVNAAGTAIVITGVSQTTPMDVLAVAHGFVTAQQVSISAVLGSTTANGAWTITKVDADNFTLNASAADPNAYVSGGVVYRLGPDSTQPGAGPYNYVYTFRNTQTNNEGNPSTLMDNSLWVSSQNGVITVTVWGSPDTAQITGAQSIAIYRSGGSFADAVYRLVGYVTNPGVTAGVPVSTTFVDTTPDISLAFADQAEFDNYPPVVSTLRFPVNATISSITPGTYPGFNTLTLSLPVNNLVLPGTSVTLGSMSSGTTNNQEVAYIAANPQPASTGTNATILLYLQLAHVTGEPVLIDAVVGQPCSLAISAFDSLLLAGDDNNPHVLYKSKTGRPESFPIIDSSGNSGSINVGTPSNGIQNICEFRGKILCLNVSNLYEVDVFSGVMYGPTETPAQRGLLVRWAFCKADNAVYYLAYDGIYVWDGGQSRKMSEGIDPIFHPSAPAGQYPSMDLTENGLQYCRMEYYRSQVYFSYIDTNGNFWLLRYEPGYDRWTQELYLAATGGGNPLYFYFYTEPDTSAFIFARTDAGGGVISQADQGVLNGGLLQTSDEFTTAGNNGNPIPYKFQTAFFVPDNLIKYKLFLDLTLEYTAPGMDQFQIKVFYDYSAVADTIDQFTITPNSSNRTFVTLPLQLSGIPAISSGKEAFAVSILVSGTASALTAFHTLGMRYLDRGEVQQGITSDWMNFGSNNDKKLYQLHLEHNTGGIAVTLHMDIRYGINGTSQANDVATFLISSTEKTTVTLPIPETAFPNNLTICKSLRLRPAYTGGVTVVAISAVLFTGTSNAYTYTLTSGPPLIAGKIIVIAGLTDAGNNGVFTSINVNPTTFTGSTGSGITRAGQTGTGTASAAQNYFRIFYQPTFDKEDYPPDIVLFTPWDDNGYPLDKYVQEVLLEVDTAGHDIQVQVQADGTMLQTVTVNTTSNDRHRNITLSPNLIGRQWRIFVDPATIPAGGKFQLFQCKYQFQNADRGPVNHTFDYDDLEWPYDKALTTVNFEFDTTIGGSFTIAMDTVTGIDGATLNRQFQTFALPPTGRGKKTFAINPGTIAVMVRMYPLSDNVGSKQWGYKFDKTNYPADIVTFTESMDFGYPCEKIARNLILNIDTGGVGASIAVQADGVTVQTFTVNTTNTTRSVILPFTSTPQPIGKLWRLLITPGAGGKAQLFSWTIDYIKEPCQVNFWDSYEQAFGYDGFKMIKQIWLEYACPVPITLTILTDNARVFYVAQLPAHANRDVERFYLPDMVSTPTGAATVDSSGLVLTWVGGATFSPLLQSITLNGALYPVGIVISPTLLTLGSPAPAGPQLVSVTVLNKSKVYRFQVASTTQAGFKFYLDGSRIEFAPLGSDQRGGYSQMKFSEAMKIPAEPTGFEGLTGGR